MTNKFDSKSSKDILIRFAGKDFRIKVFFEGILIGIVVGLVISAFRYLLEKAEAFRTYSYSFSAEPGLIDVVFRFLILILIAGIISSIIKKAPQTAGSGIVQVKGYLLGYVKLTWLRNLLGKFFGAVIAIGAGLSLGRQGPAVQIGASIGQGVSRTLGRLRVEEKYLVTSGAGAGLAAAFNAPLAGVVFALEEVHKSFSPAALMSTMGAALSADFIMRQFFGSKPIMDFSGIQILPQKYYFLLLGLGIFCGIAGVLFNKILLWSYQLYDQLAYTLPWIPRTWFPLFPLILAGILGYFLPQVLGGGETFITSLAGQNYALSFLLILLVIKFVFTMLSAASGAPGGIFLPMLLLGALVGNIYGSILITLHLGSSELIQNFIVFAMAALFTAVVKAPITGSILITEMTGSFEHLLPVIIVSMLAYLVSDLFKTKSVYDDLLQLTIIDKNKPEIKHCSISSAEREKHTPARRSDSKTIIEQVVCSGSMLEGQKVKNISWPKGCLIVSICRGGKEIIPLGDTIIHTGDFLYILIDQSKESEPRVFLHDLCKEKLC